MLSEREVEGKKADFALRILGFFNFLFFLFSILKIILCLRVPFGLAFFTAFFGRL